jgi:hypothetical protein
MALTATPLSSMYLYRVAIDMVRSHCGEMDTQEVTNDEILAYLMNNTVELFKTFPQVRREYKIAVPFTLSAAPTTGTMPPPTSAPEIYTATSGTHYDAPTNFIILGWFDLTCNDMDAGGSTREMPDHPQLHGHQFAGNTLWTRSIGWYAYGRNLEVSVGAGVADDVIITGHAYRTPIAAIQLEVTGTSTGLTDIVGTSGYDESLKYKPAKMDFEFMDCDDQYCPLVIKKAALNVYAKVGQRPNDDLVASVDAGMARLHEGAEQAMLEMQNRKKQTMYREQGHP